MPLFELDDVFTYPDAKNIKRFRHAAPPDEPGDEHVWPATSQEPFRLKRCNKKHLLLNPATGKVEGGMMVLHDRADWYFNNDIDYVKGLYYMIKKKMKPISTVSGNVNNAMRCVNRAAQPGPKRRKICS